MLDVYIIYKLVAFLSRANDSFSRPHDPADQSLTSSGRQRRKRKRNRGDQNGVRVDLGPLRDQATNTDYSSNGNDLYLLDI